MSLRATHTQPTESTSSPSKADAKHRAQLASYKRPGGRVPASSKLAQLSAALSGRRLSRVDEHAASGADAEERKGHGRRPYRRRKRTWLLIFGGAAFYLLIVRPLLSSSSGSSASAPQRSAKSAQLLDRTRGATPPLHERRHDTLAPLPPAVMARSLPDHPIRDGLLHVDPKSKVHPIYQLIRDSRTAWDDRVARQSKTLKDAVAEYRRRYGQAPPKGFDKWWAYVREHDVQLPDEYDQIDRDLRPFRALHPRDLKARIEQASTLPDTYTIKVRHGSIRTSVGYGAIEGADQRLEGQTELLRPVAKWLTDFTAVYSVHDGPTVVLSNEHRDELSEHVDDDEFIDVDDEIDMTLRGWAAACPPTSKLRTFDRYANPPADRPKSFIATSHAALMDLCAHPELVSIHGVLSGKNPHVGPLMPVFALSKTNLHADILGIPTEQWADNLPDIPWEDRHQDRLLWRGSNTGAYFSAGTTWRASHRARLMRLSSASNGLTSVLAPPRLMRGEQLGSLVATLNTGDINTHYMDMAFTGKPIQCDMDDGTCNDLQEEFVFGPQMTHQDAFYYKYIIDIDGNAWSARFQRLLASGSLVFKSTIMPEWWTDRIQPWVHYVPVQLDYSDLYDAITFFRGDLDGRGGEPALAKEIAFAGRKWASTHWRKADMTAYVFRLYLEWARLVADRRSTMDFVYDTSMEIEA